MGNNPVKFSYKQIWFIAYPILISLVMEQLIGMTDTAFMGRVGEVELGASAIAGVYYMTFYMIAFGFSLGAQIIMGRRNGEGNYAKIGPIFYKGTYFLLGVALVLFVSSHFVSPLILERFIDSPHVHEAAVSYIRLSLVGSEMCIRDRLYSLAGIWIFLFIRSRDVPRLFRGNNPNKDSDTQFDCHGIVECRV